MKRLLVFLFVVIFVLALGIMPAAAQKVVLNWSPYVNNPAACGPVTVINIFRVAAGATPPVAGLTPHLASVNIPLTTYTDTTVSYGSSYDYYISAWAGTCQKESVVSAKTTAVIPVQIIIPSAPTGLSNNIVIP